MSDLQLKPGCYSPSAGRNPDEWWISSVNSSSECSNQVSHNSKRVRMVCHCRYDDRYRRRGTQNRHSPPTTVINFCSRPALSWQRSQIELERRPASLYSCRLQFALWGGGLCCYGRNHQHICKRLDSFTNTQINIWKSYQNIFYSGLLFHLSGRKKNRWRWWICRQSGETVGGVHWPKRLLHRTLCCVMSFPLKLITQPCQFLTVDPEDQKSLRGVLDTPCKLNFTSEIGNIFSFGRLGNNIIILLDHQWS